MSTQSILPPDILKNSGAFDDESIPRKNRPRGPENQFGPLSSVKPILPILPKGVLKDSGAFPGGKRKNKKSKSKKSKGKKCRKSKKCIK